MQNLEFHERQRKQLVSDRIAELMSGNAKKDADDYSTSNALNIGEFMQEVGEKEIAELKEIIDNRRTYAAGDAEYFAALGRCFHCQLTEYWERLAEGRAEFEIPSTGELMNDAKAEAAQARHEAAAENRMAA